jgi:hypothetical protein
VPEWLQIAGAVGSLISALGVVIAIFVVIRDGRRFSRDESRREDEAKSRLAEQARLVAVLPVMRGRHDLDVGVINHSAAPVFDLHIRTPRLSDERFTPHHGGKRAGTQLNLQMLPPHGAHPVAFRVMGSGAVPPNDISVIEAEIEFTDANGVRWRRRNTSPPEMITD